MHRRRGQRRILISRRKWEAMYQVEKITGNKFYRKRRGRYRRRRRGGSTRI